MSINYYHFLGIPNNSSDIVVKKAYNSMWLEFHPDKIRDITDKSILEKARKITDILALIKTTLLGDNKTKENYDRNVNLDFIYKTTGEEFDNLNNTRNWIAAHRNKSGSPIIETLKKENQQKTETIKLLEQQLDELKRKNRELNNEMNQSSKRIKKLDKLERRHRIVCEENERLKAKIAEPQQAPFNFFQPAQTNLPKPMKTLNIKRKFKAEHIPKIKSIKKVISRLAVEDRRSDFLTGFSLILLEFNSESERDTFAQIFRDMKSILINKMEGHVYATNVPREIFTETLLSEFGDTFLTVSSRCDGFFMALEDFISCHLNTNHNLAKYSMPVLKILFDLVGVPEKFIRINDNSGKGTFEKLKKSHVEKSAKEEITLESLINMIETTVSSNSRVIEDLANLKQFIVPTAAASVNRPEEPIKTAKFSCNG